jgi:hypothetical protein
LLSLVRKPPALLHTIVFPAAVDSVISPPMIAATAEALFDHRRAIRIRVKQDFFMVQGIVTELSLNKNSGDEGRKDTGGHQQGMAPKAQDAAESNF